MMKLNESYLMNTIIFSLLTLVFRFLLIGYCAVNFNNQSAIFEDNLNYLSLFKFRFIEDISLIDKNSTCPTYYELLKLGETPPLFWCRSRKDSKGNKLIGANCTLDQPSFSVDYWRNKSFCLKRSIYNYYNSTIIKSNLSCPNNYVDCGIVDNLNNKLCLSGNSTCPIKYISIIPNNSYLINYTFIYKIQKFSDDHILITSNDSKLNLSAIMNLNYNKGNKCSNYLEDGLDKYDLNSYNIYYYAKPCNKTISKIAFNPYYFKIDSLNGSFCKDYLECKSFPSAKDNFLYYSISPVINFNCIDLLTDNLKIDSLKFLSKIRTSLIICCLGILICIFSFLNICFLNEMREKVVKIFTFLIIMFLFSELLFLIYTFSLKQNHFFEILHFSKEKLCFDNYLTLLFMKLKEISHYDQLINFFVLEIILCFIQLFMYIGFLIIFSKIIREYPNMQGILPFLRPFILYCENFR